jgi:ferredoxin/flavodoxin---NADP+ reductase
MTIMNHCETAADVVSMPIAVAPPVSSSMHYVETVLWVKHWTDAYFSFAVTRPPSFRFRSGEFVMIGLPIGGKSVLRAYSIASPAWSDELEFFSIKVPDGLLTSRLQNIQPGDHILLGKKPTGTLVLDTLRSGKRLFLLGTGTGIAPWLAVVRDPNVYESFEQVIVVHGVRHIKDLAYRSLFEHELQDSELLGEYVRDQLIYYPVISREPFPHQGRLTDRIRSGALFRDLALPRNQFNPGEDRVMLCGSMNMIKDVAAILEVQGFKEGSNAEAGDFVLERAFVG